MIILKYYYSYISIFNYKSILKDFYSYNYLLLYIYPPCDLFIIIYG